MQNRTTNEPGDISADPNEVRYERPEWMSPEKWAEICTRARVRFYELEHEVRDDPSWCIVGARWPGEHAEHHTSEITTLDWFTRDESHWQCYLTESRRSDDQRIKLVMFADAGDGTEKAEHLIPYELATVILAATHTQESRDRLWAVLERVNA